MPRPKPSPAPSCTFVLFGASGDLTKRLLLPSLYNLAKQGLLPEHFALLAVTYEPVTSDEFRKQTFQHLRDFGGQDIDADLWTKTVAHLDTVAGDFGDPKLYPAIADKLRQMDQDAATGGNALFYFATPPQFFGPIVQQLGKVGLTQEDEGRWRRVVIEKPFGRDLASAQALNAEVLGVVQETQVYRVDHYQGKETVQNILVFRFANGLFEPVWNRNSIAQVQITVAESLGIEARGGYYDGAGALRDMVQNHLLSLLSLIAMESPVSMEADAVRDERTKTLHSVQPLRPEDVLTRVVRGQYGAGEAGGRRAPAYRAEKQVAPDSDTETFVALQLEIDTWRWAGVPFYLRTGKYLPQRVTEVAVQFKPAPAQLFRETPIDEITPNWLVMHVQPDEGISLELGAKIPGPTVDIGAVQMRFNYEDYFGHAPRTGYETLLYDAMIGDQTLFQRADTVEAGWQIVQPILDVWHALPARDFPNYAPGTWGPDGARQLLARSGHAWRDIHPPSTRTKR